MGEIGFFAPRIMKLKSKSMMDFSKQDIVESQSYAYNDTQIYNNLLGFFGYQTPAEEQSLRRQKKSPVQEILCSLATPRPGGAPSPLEYIIISNVQGVIENKHYIHNAKPVTEHNKDAEIKQKQFLDIASSNIKGNSPLDIETVSKIKGK